MEQILMKLKPDYKIQTQIPLYILTDRNRIALSSRKQKESIDVVFHKDGEIIACRVQGKRHKGRVLTADRHQRSILEGIGIKVIDFKWQECPYLFEDVVNDLSIEEVKRVLKENNFAV